MTFPQLSTTNFKIHASSGMHKMMMMTTICHRPEFLRLQELAASADPVLLCRPSEASTAYPSEQHDQGFLQIDDNGLRWSKSIT